MPIQSYPQVAFRVLTPSTVFWGAKSRASLRISHSPPPRSLTAPSVAASQGRTTFTAVTSTSLEVSRELSAQNMGPAQGSFEKCAGSMLLCRLSGGLWNFIALCDCCSLGIGWGNQGTHSPERNPQVSRSFGLAFQVSSVEIVQFCDK